MPTKFLKDMTICADTVCMPPYMKINGLWSILEHEPKLLGGWMCVNVLTYKKIEPTLFSESLAKCSVPNDHGGPDRISGIDHPPEPLH